ncbi:MAG: toprim domain-containing protein [Paracoccaceae bacterium]|nr:MAG: toprim domain-containing protein [Paracoccaceae bacterium]
MVASVCDAQLLTLSRGGRWYGRYGTLPCPLCQPEARPGQNALTLSDGAKGLLAHCKKTGCAFRDVAAALGITPGTFSAPNPAILAQHAADRQAEAEKRARQARTIWVEAAPISGTIAETYLRGRGITCDLPDSLRFHPEAWHGPTARRLPALVARVDGSSSFAVHRTFLRQDGNGKAEVEPQKAMLGAVKGGAVQLARASGPLVVAEGIETALSLASGLLCEPATVWAALSTSGMRALELPACTGRLTVACDGDAPGRAAALMLAERAYGLGWRVGLLDPGDGADFNDLLRKGVAA